MTIVRTVADLRAALAHRQGRVGFVPTMGFLHKGHLSLLQKAKHDEGFSVISIFVNPTQFGPNEDFDRYPRDEARDLELCRQVDADVVWLPSVSDLYPDPDGGRTWVDVDGPSDLLEGTLRPGHFRGVATVVCKLSNAVGPCALYLGQKDAQQVAVIKRMLADLFMPQRLVVCPIIREPDGLAMSSRNTYLKPEERRNALALSRGLSLAQAAFTGGERRAAELENLVKEHLEISGGLVIQYVQALDPINFRPVETVQSGSLLALAVFCGKTRLIDNIIFGGRE